MAEFKQNYFQRRTKDRGPKSNNRINSPEVQVIASNGENLGILNTNEAIAMAKKPILMANSFRNAVLAGRGSYLSGRIAKSDFANPSSPTKGLI